MEAAAETEELSVPLFKKRGPKKSVMRKRPLVPDSNSASDSEHSTDDEESERRVKHRKRTGGVLASNAPATRSSELDFSTTKFSADRTAAVNDSNDATKQSNWYENTTQLSATDLLGSASRNATRKKQSAAQDTGARYDTSALNPGKRKEEEEGSSSKAKGPVKAPTNVRTITVTDYAPDVCKDYKQTGWCGFGDSCKFLHEREAYSQGWQLDREWEKAGKGKKTGGTVVSSRNKDKELGEDENEELAKQLESIPFACIICRGEYKNPTVTKCGHYFCESCALKRFRKTPNCAACGTGTGGVFNGAKNLRKLLDKKRERAEKKREKAREAGEEVGAEEEEELPEVKG